MLTFYEKELKILNFLLLLKRKSAKRTTIFLKFSNEILSLLLNSTKLVEVSKTKMEKSKDFPKIWLNFRKYSIRKFKSERKILRLTREESKILNQELCSHLMNTNSMNFEIKFMQQDVN